MQIKPKKTGTTVYLPEDLWLYIHRHRSMSKRTLSAEIEYMLTKLIEYRTQNDQEAIELAESHSQAQIPR